MTGVERTLRYCKSIKNKEILSCRMVQLAVERFERDLKNSKNNDYPYYFDTEAANHIVKFAEATKQFNDHWRGKNLKLEDWQCFIFCNIYGWKRKDNNRRRFRKSLVQVGRKNGKSTMIAITLLYDLLLTNGAQCYTAATKREQAKIVFNCCKQIVAQNKALSSRLRVYTSTSRIANESKAGFLEALASQTDHLDGLNPSVAVIDEIGSQKNMDLVKVIESGQGSRPEPLLFEIGSATDDMESAGKQEHDRAKKILEQVEEDDSFFCIVYELEDKDDWTNEDLYIKANPNLGISVEAEFLHNLKVQALSSPSYEGELRTKCLGQYISPITSWIQPKVWTVSVDNAQKYKFDNKKGYFALGALDLSKRNDLTAFTVCIYQEGKYYLKHKAYFPADMMSEKLKTDSELWAKWTETGILTATPGSVINYQILFKDIMEAYDKYKLDSVLFDPYNSSSLIVELQDNIDLVEVPQSIKNLSPFVKRFEEEIYKGNIVDDNPLMRWEMSNAEVYRDPNDNLKIIKPDSRSSGKRIDNVITSLMAVGRIGQLLDNGEIDTRTPEEAGKQTEDFLKNLNLFG